MALQAIAIQLGLGIGLKLLSRWMIGPDTRRLPRPQPEGLEFAQATIGGAVPIVYGTVRVDSPVLVDAAEFSYRPKAGAWDYCASLLLAVGTPPAGGPAPVMLRFWYGDNSKELGAINTGLLHTNSRTVEIDLGGDGNGGTFRARVEFYDGRADQVTTNGLPVATTELDKMYRRTSGLGPLSAHVLDEIPGYARQMLVAVIAPDSDEVPNCQLGESSRLAAMAMEVRAQGPDGVGIYDANPARVLYDLISAEVWKIGYPTALIDAASFDSAAATLTTEGHGCSVQVLLEEPAEEVLFTLLDQINGLLYEEPTTGQISLRLIRSDYDVGTLPELTTSNTLGEPEITVTGWATVANQVIVAFTDRANNYKRNTATAQRLANAVGQSNRVRTRTVEYPCCTSQALADSLAARELGATSRPLMAGRVRVDRTMHALKHGDAIKATWPGIATSKVFRVVEIDQGQLADGAITLTLIEDVFGQTAGAFPGAVYEPALPYLLPIHERYLTEAPYWMLQKLATLGTISDASVQRIFAMAANPDDALATSFSVDATNPFDPSGPLMDDVPSTVSFLRYGEVITSAYPRTAEPYDTTTHLTIQASTALDKILTTGLLAVTDADIQDGRRLCALVHADGTHEFIAFKDYVSLGSQQWSLRNVWRGLMDTAPIDHPIGTRFFYLSDYANQVGRRGRAASTISAQFLPAGSVLDGSGDDPTDTLTIVERGKLPLPAANFTLYGNEMAGTVGTSSAGYKEVSSIDAEFQVAASRRLRTSATITRGDAAAETPEAGTTYDVIAQKVAANGLAFDADEVTVLAGLTIPAQDGLLLGGAGHGSIDVKLRTRNAGKASWTDPTVRVQAAHYRNLLCNGRAQDDDGLASTLGWTVSAGALATGTGGPAGAAVGYHFTGGAAAGTTTFYQDVDLAGYLPGGLSATLSLYVKPELPVDGDALDSITVTLQPLTAGGVATGSSATTGALAYAGTAWKRVDLTHTLLPKDATQVRVTITLTVNAGSSADNTASVKATELSLRVGQATGNLLLDPSFEL